MEAKRLRALLVVVLILLVAGMYVVWSLLMQAPEEEVTGEPDIIEPSITTMEEVEELTAGKPVPPTLTIASSRLPDDEHVIGDRTTEVSFIEYANIQSPYTKLIHPALKEFQTKNSDTLHWAFRHFPLSTNAIDWPAARATECVAIHAGNDAFWTYLSSLIDQNESLTEADLLQLGSSVVPDPTSFQNCITYKETEDYVLLDKQGAQLTYKIFVTPSFVFINHTTGDVRVVEGLNTMEYLQQVLDEMTASNS